MKRSRLIGDAILIKSGIRHARIRMSSKGIQLDAAR